jgi:hypothetical protein
MEALWKRKAWEAGSKPQASGVGSRLRRSRATTDERTRRYLTDLLGDEPVATITETHGRHAHRQRSTPRTYRPIATAPQLQRLRDGTGLLIHTNLPRAIVALRPNHRDRRLQRLAAGPPETTPASAPRSPPTAVRCVSRRRTTSFNRLVRT